MRLRSIGTHTKPDLLRRRQPLPAQALLVNWVATPPELRGLPGFADSNAGDVGKATS